MTFDELRLASMLSLAQQYDRAGPPAAARPDLARLLADLVIHIDRLAAAKNIDLAQAIRERFEPERRWP